MAIGNETLETIGGIKNTIDSIKGGGAAKDGVTDNTEPLEKLVERLEESLTEEMKEIIDAINGKSNKGKETKNAASSIFSQEDIEQLSGFMNGGEEEEFTPPKSGKVTPADLSKIDQTFALGSLLTYYKLDEIKQALDPLIKKLMGSKGGKEGQTATGNEGINSSVKNLGPLVQNIKEFAKASFMMALVPKKAAEAGLNLFINFVETFSKMSETIDAEKQKKFSEALTSMSEGIKKFAGACIMLALTLPFILVAIPAMFLMRNVIRLASEAGELTLENSVKFVVLAVGATILSVAFMLFGVAFIIMAKILPLVPKALLGMLAVVGIITMTIAIGALLSLAIPVLLVFPVVAVLISIGYLMMSLAVLTLSNLKVDKEKIQKGLDSIKVVLQETATLGILCLPLLLLAIPFILVSALLFVGFATLYLALVTLALISFFIGKGEWIKTATDKITQFFSAFGNEEFLQMVALAMVSAIALTVASVFILISFIAMTVGILLLKAIDKLITDKNMISNIMGPDGYFGQIMDTTISLGLKALLATAAAIPLVAFGALFAVAMVALTLAIGAIVVMDKLLSQIKNPSLVGEKLRGMCVDILLSSMGLESDGHISVGDLVKGGLNLAGMTTAAGLIIPFAIAMALAMTSFVITVEAVKTLSKVINSFGPSDVQNVMSVIGIILGTLAESAEAFKGTSAKTMTAMGSLVKDVAEAISTLTDVVTRLKDGIPDEQIDSAVYAIKRICEKLFGNPDTDNKGEYNLTVLFKQLASSKLKNLKTEAVAALVPIIGAIDNLADLVVKVSDEDQFSQQRIDMGTQNIERFLGLMVNVASAMKTLVKVDGGWFGAKLLGNKSPLEAVEEVVNSGFFEKFNIMINQMSESARIVGSARTEDYQGFIDFWQQDFSKMSDSTYSFKVAFKNISDAFKNVNDKTLDSYERFIRISTMDTSGATQTISSLTALADLSPKFVAIADAFSRMATSMDTMAKKTSKLNEMFDKMKKAEKTATAMANMGSGSISEGTGSGGADPNVELLYAIVDSWNRNGVPIRANINSTENKLEPDNVNNTTGMSSRRNWQ